MGRTRALVRRYRLMSGGLSLAGFAAGGRRSLLRPLSGVGRLLLRQRLTIGIVALGLIAGGAGGALVSTWQPVVYRATASFVVTAVPSGPAGRSSGVQSVVDERPMSPGGWKQVVSSYAEVATAPIVLDPVIRRLGLSTTAKALARRLHVEQSSDSPRFTVGVDGADPHEAARIADAIAHSEVAAVHRLSPSGESPPRLSVVGRSARTAHRIEPDVVVDVLTGALLGVLLAAVVVALRRPEAVG